MNRQPPPNLHPIWYRHFGFQAPSAPRPDTPAKAMNPAVTAKPAALRLRSASEINGWEPTCSHRPPAGAPVGIRRQLGPHTWEHTVVLPGDSRYPWLEHTTDSTH